MLRLLYWPGWLQICFTLTSSHLLRYHGFKVRMGADDPLVHLSCFYTSSLNPVSYTHCQLRISIWMPELNFLLPSPKPALTHSFHPLSYYPVPQGRNIGPIPKFVVSLTSYHPFHLFLQNRSRIWMFLSSFIVINLVWATIISLMDSCSSLLLPLYYPQSILHVAAIK